MGAHLKYNVTLLSSTWPSVQVCNKASYNGITSFPVVCISGNDLQVGAFLAAACLVVGESVTG